MTMMNRLWENFERLKKKEMIMLMNKSMNELMKKLDLMKKLMKRLMKKLQCLMRNQIKKMMK